MTRTPLSTPTSPKVWAATAGSFLASLVLSIALAVQSDPTVLSGLPKPLLFIAVAVLPSIVTFVSGYAQRDKLRDAGAEAEADTYVGRHDDATQAGV